MIKKVAILVNGGDCSGLNPVIRGIMKTAKEKNIELLNDEVGLTLTEIKKEIEKHEKNTLQT